jgi:integrase
MPRARRKKRNKLSRGCSIASHNGRLRLEWRSEHGRATWSTGDRDTPESRDKWEGTRIRVAKLRNAGIDPLPHLASLRAPATPDAPPAPTIRSVFPDWRAGKRGRVRPALFRDYTRHMSRYVLTDVIADIPMAELRPRHIQGLQARLCARLHHRTGKPISEKTVRGVINGTLQAFCRDAQVNDDITRNLFVGLLWKRWTPPEADPLDVDEWQAVDTWFRQQTFQRFLKWRAHPAFHGFVFFLRWHGARPSEAAALTWDDIDLKKGIAYVRASFHCHALSDPKTKTARRTIELHPEMLSILKALRPLRPEPGQPVFTNLDGNRITNQHFWQTWKRCLEACRVRHRGIYALKDSFVSHTLRTAEETGQVERLTAWLVRQTGVRLDTLREHYAKWWPRDTDAIAATYALLDGSVGTQNGHFVTRVGGNGPKTQQNQRSGRGS